MEESSYAKSNLTQGERFSHRTQPPSQREMRSEQADPIIAHQPKNSLIRPLKSSARDSQLTCRTCSRDEKKEKNRCAKLGRVSFLNGFLDDDTHSKKWLCDLKDGKD